MKYQFELQNTLDDPSVPDQFTIQRLLDLTLENRIDTAGVCIRIVDEAESTQLNKQFRGKDKPTNVLSFASDIPDEVPQEIPLLGDLVLCAGIVQQEAKAQNKSVQAHWTHLLIHGLLHLLGYDHVEKQQAQEMEAIEIELLAELGISNPYQEICHE